MTKASDNLFPKVILNEAATDGSDFSNPSADYRVLFLGEDGALHLKDSAGSVTSVGGGIADQGTFTYLDATEAAAPGTPASGKVRIYAKTDGRIYSKDDGGTEYGPFDAAGSTTPGVLQTVISPYGIGSIGRMMRELEFSNASYAWQTANLALLIPFVLSDAVTAYKLGWFNGATVSGNVDVGIYDASGTRVISTGSTAQSGTSAVQVVDIADTSLSAGVLYYLATSMDNTTGTLQGWQQYGPLWACLGVRAKTSSFALPSSITSTSDPSTTRCYFSFIEARNVS